MRLYLGRKLIADKLKARTHFCGPIKVEWGLSAAGAAVHSLGRSDYEKLKEMVLGFLDQTRAVVRPSAEEELACMTLDWFVV